MKTGADRKKVTILLSLVGFLAVYKVYDSLTTPSADQPASKNSRTTEAKIPDSKAPPDIGRAAATRKGLAVKPDSGEFRPSLKRKPDDPFIDPMKADPTLRMELMTRVQAVQIEGGVRNLFQFGVAPPAAPQTPEKDIKIPVKLSALGPTLPGGVATPGDPSKPPAPPPPPPPPPLSVKFYGFTSREMQTNRRAFFLSGENIIVAGEGDVIEKRYKVVRIGVNSAVVEDTESKQEQTVPLEEEKQPG